MIKKYLAHITILVLNLYSYLHASCAQSVQFSPEGGDEVFRNLILAKSHLLLGSSSALYRLDHSLAKQEKKSLGAANRMLVTDYVGSFRDNVLSCSSESCFLAQITDFTNISWQVNPPFIRELGTDNVVAVFARRANGTSDLTYGERAGPSIGSRLLAKGSLINVGTSNVVQSFNRYVSRFEENRFDPLVYLTEFSLRYTINGSGYVYFVVRPNEGETRLVRFCEDDPGILGIFASHFEIRLKCGSHGDRNLSTAATFINITTAFNNRSKLLISTNRVLSMNGMQLEVCAFDIGTINSLMTQKFENCIGAINNAMAGFVRDGQSTCIAVQQSQFVGECFLPGTARPGLEVPSPYIQEPLITIPLSNNSATTSMVHTTLDGTLYLYCATTNGSLLQFHIANVTTSYFVRAIQLPLASQENITRMVASDSGEYIFAMTLSRVLRHPVDMCHTFISCSECLTSGDPICGWCPLHEACTRQSNCPIVAPVTTLVWITQARTCPSIQSISPEIVYIPDQLMSNTTLTLTTLNIASTLLSVYNYNCRFQFKDTIGKYTTFSDTMATQSDDVFTCTVPPTNQIPQLINGQDTLETVISLVVRGRDVSIAAIDTFPFTDCAVPDSCTSCIETSRCEWCSFSFQCVQPGATCMTQELAVVNGNMCPQIFPSSATGEYLIHINYDYQQNPLRIKSSNLSQFRDDFNSNRFQCQICSQDDFSCSSPLLSAPASLAPGGNEVICQRTRFDSNVSTPAITARFRLVLNNQRIIDNPDNASVILYSCSLMGSNCGQCLAQESRFNCSYCVEGAVPVIPGSCQLSLSCSTANSSLRFDDLQDIIYCPSPVIFDFEPKAGPTRGGTIVNITGSNLGARRQDIISVMINGIPCNISSYTPGISISCITGESKGGIISGNISISLAYLSNAIQTIESFTFVTPFLSNPPAQPNMGPISGGTNITIMGLNIGTGSRHRVSIGRKDCEITGVSLNIINCTTPPGDSLMDVGRIVELVEVSVDNLSFQLAGFRYVADPVFESISPDIIFIVGGLNYTITGTNLNSVQDPRLLIYYDGGPEASGNRNKRQIVQQIRFKSEPCVVESPLRMYCTAPSLSSNEFNQTSRPLQIGLLMDGVSSLLELNTSLNLHPDPVFTHFDEEMVFMSGDPIILLIQGEGFVFSANHLNVLIEPCNSDQARICQCIVIHVYPNNTISCEIDIIAQQQLETSQSLRVSVTVGNFMQEVGTIRLETNTGGIPDVSTVSTGEMEEVSTTQFEGSVGGSGINFELLYLLIPAFSVFVLVVLACGILIGLAIKIKRTRTTESKKLHVQMATMKPVAITSENVTGLAYKI